MNENCSKIEAILFACGDPVELERLAGFLKLNKDEISTELNRLKDFYKNNKTGLQIVSKGNTIQLVSNRRMGESIASFMNKRVNEPLTRTALEVLSVVAYRGPISRAQIEHIRGVNCSFMIRNLAIRGLIERQDNPVDSRSYLYAISYEFLKSMGIEDIKNLPDFELLSRTDLEERLSEEEDSD